MNNSILIHLFTSFEAKHDKTQATIKIHPCGVFNEVPKEVRSYCFSCTNGKLKFYL